jgi:hypothetical protein
MCLAVFTKGPCKIEAAEGSEWRTEAAVKHISEQSRNTNQGCRRPPKTGNGRKCFLP